MFYNMLHHTLLFFIIESTVNVVIFARENSMKTLARPFTRE